MRTLVVFGDSYVAAANRRRPGWARLLSLMLLRRPVLLGLGGTGFVRSAADGRQAYPSRITELLSAPGSMAIVQASGNDAPCDLAEVEVVMDRFLRIARDRFSRLVVVGPMWALEGAEHLPALRDVTQRVCVELGLPFLDGLGWVTAADMGPDGAHPTWSGHRRIALRAWAALRATR